MKHVFIVGSKGIPGTYGGYETFVDKLTEYHKDNKSIKYHVACKSTENSEFKYNNARCFNIKVPNVGSAQAIYYDILALINCCDYIKKNHIKNPIVYILACRIGPFAAYFQKKIHKLGGKVFLNPDGHEWLRAKWPYLVRRYWKMSEAMMVKHADLIICDSRNIEDYINDIYSSYNPNTTFIAYGAETRKSLLANDDEELLNWYKEKGVSIKNYYLVVGRFVPENNYEIMIKEFMRSKSDKDFVLITNVSDKFMNELKKKTKFYTDHRIKFVGTVYNQELLKKIRENAYGYFHGHEVGGTNPSLLEALGSTDLNLLLDVGFNREVGEKGAIYWNKEIGSLSNLIEEAENMSEIDIRKLGIRAKSRIANAYSWENICTMYEEIFMKGSNLNVEKSFYCNNDSEIREEFSYK
ncbi:MAG: glycosyltransferase family 1 protein [Clostridium sp.]|nr:glycosyltransferase family 1 protein [Clostridium sp.]